MFVCVCAKWELEVIRLWHKMCHFNISFWQVYEELLSETQAPTVVALLHKAVSMVKENPSKAVSSSLTWIDTPTSSPTASRKSYKYLETEAAKVSAQKTFYLQTIFNLIITFRNLGLKNQTEQSWWYINHQNIEEYSNC